MMQIHSGLEMSIVAIGIVAMLSMASWLLFRSERNGEKSLFSKILEPYDIDVNKRVSVPLLLPSFPKRMCKDSPSDQDDSVDVVNQNVSAGLCGQAKEVR